MAIIIEGHDATGKSSLALYLVNILRPHHYTIVESEGPARSDNEIHERIARYATLPDKTIFVRHPCVSNPIYDVGRRADKKIVYPIFQGTIHEFYLKNHTFIYCDPGQSRQKHVPKDGESPDHIAMVEHRYEMILRQYREWAIRRAHMIYRIGDDERLTLKLVL